MNQKKTTWLISLFIIALFSCTKTSLDEEYTSPAITYSADVAPLMFNHCITCHGGLAPSAGIALTNYEEVKYFTENGNLLERINLSTDPMPPSEMLGLEQRQIIEKWVRDGYLKN